MRMEKRKFRIGELAKHLDVERFVIRFWEKEFAIKTIRSAGGQRFYSQDDLNTFCIIKELLYQQGFTISGARKHIGELKAKNKTTSIIASHKIHMSDIQSPVSLSKSLITVHEQLVRLRKLL